MVLLDQQDQAFVVVENVDSVPYKVQLPPPVVLGLGELCLSVMAESVRVLCVDAAQLQGLFFWNVSRAVPGVVSGELLGVQLDAEGEKNL